MGFLITIEIYLSKLFLPLAVSFVYIFFLFILYPFSLYYLFFFLVYMCVISSSLPTTFIFFFSYSPCPVFSVSISFLSSSFLPTFCAYVLTFFCYSPRLSFFFIFITSPFFSPFLLLLSSLLVFLPLPSPPSSFSLYFDFHLLLNSHSLSHTFMKARLVWAGEETS